MDSNSLKDSPILINSDTLLCKEWRYSTTLSVLIFLLIAFICPYFDIFSRNVYDVRSELCDTSEQPSYSWLNVYIMGAGAVGLQLIMEAMKFIGLSHHHDHSYAMRVLCIALLSFLMMSCITMVSSSESISSSVTQQSREAINHRTHDNRIWIIQADEMVSWPLMCYMILAIDYRKERLSYMDMFILLCIMIVSVIYYRHDGVGMYLIIMAWTMLMITTIHDKMTIKTLRGIKISCVYLINAAKHRYVGACILVAGKILLLSLAKQHHPIMYDIINICHRLCFIAFIESDYHDIFDPMSVSLSRERNVTVFERRYLKKNLHEIREPLNLISVGCQYLQDTVFDNESDHYLDNQAAESIRDNLSIIRYASSYMSKTLNVTLTSIVKEEVIDVVELFESVYLCQKIDASSRGIRIETMIEANVPQYFISDRDRIEHVIMNLLNNAIKFSYASSTIRIIARLGDIKPHHLTIAVVDEGIGMSEENIAKLFTPFVQFDAGKNQEGKGTGLGLSMCRDLIRALGGDICCKSRLRPKPQDNAVMNDDSSSYGSEFYFYIPLVVHPSGSAYDNHHQHDQDDVISAKQSSSTDTMHHDDHDDTMFSDQHHHHSSSKDNIAMTRLDSMNEERRLSISNELSLHSMSSNSALYQALVVDDVESNRKILMKILTKKGYQCDDACNGKVAYQTFMSHVDEASVSLMRRIRSLESYTPKLSPPKSRDRNSLDSDFIGTNTSSNSSSNSNLMTNLDSVSDAGSQPAIKGVNYYHIIFMDNLMPEMNGVDVIRLLRKRGYTNIIVGLTGDVADADQSEFGYCGADIVLSKPLQPTTLNNLLQTYEGVGFKSPTFYKKEAQ